MIQGPNNDLLSKINPATGTGPASSSSPASGASFANVLKDSINEVARLQQDASNAVDALASGKSDDVTGVMTAMEKSDLAFKTLLSIRSKLMDAYDEIKNIPV
ncbi:MAG TPA: flagellar hook-basal body complex protein FliE [Tepidisphaeraceae bacterium]|nr:flagellar hook-basal body complex protein FliE [Tepidisphaeraceae bacterium]